MGENTKLYKPGSQKSSKRGRDYNPVFEDDEFAVNKERANPKKKSYWDKLATPNARFMGLDTEEPQKNKRRVCISNKFCPPRIDQLANPTTTRIEGILTSFYNTLEPERVVRLVKLIHTNQEPKAKPQMIKKKKKPDQKKLQKQAKKKLEKEWLNKQADVSAQLIMDHLNARVAYTPNYKQVILSLNLMRALKAKKHNRMFKENVLKFCEQLAIIADREWEPYKKFDDAESESEEDLVPEEQKKHVFYRIDSAILLSDKVDTEEGYETPESDMEEDFVLPEEVSDKRAGPSTIYEDTEEDEAGKSKKDDWIREKELEDLKQKLEDEKAQEEGEEFDETKGEGEDGAEIKEEGEDGDKIKEEGEDGAEIKQEPEDEAEVKQEPEDGAEVKQEPEDEAEVKQEPEDGAEVKQEPEDEVEVKQEPAEEAEVKQEPEEEAEVKQESEEEAEVKQESEEKAEVKQEPEEEAEVKQEPEEAEIKEETEDLPDVKEDEDGADSKEKPGDEQEGIKEVAEVAKGEPETGDTEEDALQEAVDEKLQSKEAESTKASKEGGEGEMGEEGKEGEEGDEGKEDEGEEGQGEEGEGEESEEGEEAKEQVKSQQEPSEKGDTKESEKTSEKVKEGDEKTISEKVGEDKQDVLSEPERSSKKIAIRSESGTKIDVPLIIGEDGEEMVELVDKQGNKILVPVKDLQVKDGKFVLPEGTQVAQPIGKEPKMQILSEHPEGTASYVAYRVYSSWLEEFGQNIQTYSSCLRTFREIVARAQQDRDSNAAQHLPSIREVLLNWSSYLSDTMQFESTMKDYFKGKTVTRCHKCSDEYSMHNLPSDEQHPLPAGLRKALAHTAQWKQLLANAERHCQQFATIPESESFSSSYITVDVQDMSSLFSSESAYIVEEVDDD